MTLPRTMRVIEISRPGGPEVLVPAERTVPVPGPGQILVRMEAAGVNRPDALQREGNYAPPPGASDLPGLEGAGTVAAVGPGVSRWSVGDAVTALFPGGSYAEYAVTHEDHALRIPEGMDMARAAALCETYFTVWTNVFMRGGLKGGETFLVHGGTSGIGTTAIQLANAFGARAFATAGSEEKCQTCRDLGAELAVNYREADFVEAVQTATNGRGVDLILDMVAGDYIPRNIRALADEGRYVFIAFLGGAKADVNFSAIMRRRLTVTGSTLRPQSDHEKAKIAEGLRAHVWPLLDAGVVGPVMDSTFPLDQAADAHARLESSGHVGKIVLTL
jgi:NADPH2:quinone reductase